MPLTRRYEVAYLSPDNLIKDATRIAPAMPAFEEACSAFARGTLIATPHGPVAVEDLSPGQPVVTANGVQPLRWRGSITVFPDKTGTMPAILTRIPAHTFGPDRPMEHLMLGPSARFQASPATHRQAEPLTDPESCADGETAFHIRPVAPVPLYHLVLDRQAMILANGIETATYHPSLGAAAALHGDFITLFMGLFPHLRRISDFGPAMIAGGHMDVA